MQGTDFQGFPSSGAEESRTPDLIIANDALYQLSYRPMSDLILSVHRPDPRWGTEIDGGNYSGSRRGGRPRRLPAPVIPSRPHSGPGRSPKNAVSRSRVGLCASRTYAPLTAHPVARHSSNANPCTCAKANPPLK